MTLTHSHIGLHMPGVENEPDVTIPPTQCQWQTAKHAAPSLTLKSSIPRWSAQVKDGRCRLDAAKQVH